MPIAAKIANSYFVFDIVLSVNIYFLLKIYVTNRPAVNDKEAETR